MNDMRARYILCIHSNHTKGIAFRESRPLAHVELPDRSQMLRVMAFIALMLLYLG